MGRIFFGHAHVLSVLMCCGITLTNSSEHRDHWLSYFTMVAHGEGNPTSPGLLYWKQKSTSITSTLTSVERCLPQKPGDLSFSRTHVKVGGEGGETWVHKGGLLTSAHPLLHTDTLESCTYIIEISLDKLKSKRTPEPISYFLFHINNLFICYAWGWTRTLNTLDKHTITLSPRLSYF